MSNTCIYSRRHCKRRQQQFSQCFLDCAPDLYPLKLVLTKKEKSDVYQPCWLSNHPSIFPSSFLLLLLCRLPSAVSRGRRDRRGKWTNENRVNFSSSYSTLFSCREQNKLDAGRAPSLWAPPNAEREQFAWQFAKVLRLLRFKHAKN